MSKRNSLKALSLAALGNFLEVYNYVLFAVMLPVLSPIFFPSTSESLSVFLGFLSFAIAFFVAPLGSIFWGWIGDTHGRHVLLRYSIILMAGTTFAIGFLPSYEEIGILAPTLLIMLRILQGISASGGISGSKIFAMEHMGQSRYGMASGIITASGAIGVFLAWIIGLYIVSNPNNTNLWRYAFLLGGTLYFIGVFVRKYVKEIDLIKNNLEQNSNSKIYDIASVLASNKYQSLTVFFLGGMMGILSYTLHAFITPFILTLGFDKPTAYSFSMIAIMATAISAICTGIFIDFKKNNMMKQMKWHLRFVTLFTPVLWFMLLTKQTVLVIFGYIGLGYLLGVFGALSGVIMYNLFPAHLRCRGTMLNNSLGIAIFGGLTPMTFDIISKVAPYAPAFAISIYALILLFLYRKLLTNIKI